MKEVSIFLLKHFFQFLTKFCENCEKYPSLSEPIEIEIVKIKQNFSSSIIFFNILSEKTLQKRKLNFVDLFWRYCSLNNKITKSKMAAVVQCVPEILFIWEGLRYIQQISKAQLPVPALDFRFSLFFIMPSASKTHGLNSKIHILKNNTRSLSFVK
jgi:hypothetical protein